MWFIHEHNSRSVFKKKRKKHIKTHYESIKPDSCFYPRNKNTCTVWFILCTFQISHLISSLFDVDLFHSSLTFHFHIDICFLLRHLLFFEITVNCVGCENALFMLFSLKLRAFWLHFTASHLSLSTPVQDTDDLSCFECCCLLLVVWTWAVISSNTCTTLFYSVFWTWFIFHAVETQQICNIFTRCMLVPLFSMNAFFWRGAHWEKAAD